MDYVAMSGGIDSTALALLMPDAELVFTDTGDEFPELYAHLDRFEKVTGRHIERIQPFGSLPAYAIEHHYLPNFKARYCTRMFKIDAFNHWLADKLPAVLCVALRADESRTGNKSDLKGLTVRYPLQDMGIGRKGCVKVCIEHDLLPRYPVYMARGGCMGCYYKRPSEVLAMRELLPDVYAKLKAREQAVQDDRESEFCMFPNLGMMLSEFEKQPVLFDQDDVWREAGSREQYGQACGMFCHR